MKMRSKKRIIIAVILIAAAVLMLLNGLGVIDARGVSAWNIGISVICLAWLMLELSDRRYFAVVLPIAFIFMAFEESISAMCGLGGRDIISNWLLLLVAVLLEIGIWLLGSGTKERKHNDHKAVKGKNTYYVDAADISNYNIMNDLGASVVFIENADAYRGGGVLNVVNKLGSMTIYVPAGWGIDVDIVNNMGSTDIPQGLSEGEPKLKISGRNEYGSISILTR